MGRARKIWRSPKRFIKHSSIDCNISPLTHNVLLGILVTLNSFHVQRSYAKEFPSSNRHKPYLPFFFAGTICLYLAVDTRGLVWLDCVFVFIWPPFMDLYGVQIGSCIFFFMNTV